MATHNLTPEQIIYFDTHEPGGKPFRPDLTPEQLLALDTVLLPALPDYSSSPKAQALFDAGYTSPARRLFNCGRWYRWYKHEGSSCHHGPWRSCVSLCGLVTGCPHCAQKSYKEQSFRYSKLQTICPETFTRIELTIPLDADSGPKFRAINLALQTILPRAATISKPAYDNDSPGKVTIRILYLGNLTDDQKTSVRALAPQVVYWQSHRQRFDAELQSVLEPRLPKDKYSMYDSQAICADATAFMLAFKSRSIVFWGLSNADRKKIFVYKPLYTEKDLTGSDEEVSRPAKPKPYHPHHCPCCKAQATHESQFVSHLDNVKAVQWQAYRPRAQDMVN